MFASNKKKASNLKIIDVLSKRLSKDVKESLDRENINGNTPLVYAIKKQWYKLAAELIKEGFYNKDRVDEHTKLSILHNAANVNDDNLMKQLIKSFKHQINAKDMCSNTPLHYACYYRNRKYIEILINEGANINAKNKEGNTPLHLACLSNNPKQDHSTKIEELLLDKGADINAQNNNNETPLMLLFRIESEKNSEVCGQKFDPIAALMVLIKAGANIKMKAKNKMTALHYACVRGATISALTLINKDADCDALDYSDTTPYGYALKNNHEDLCIFLIQKENEVDIPVNEVVEDPDHICNQLSQLSQYVNSHEIDDLIKKRLELQKLSNMEQLNCNFKKLQTYSPFYYAIKHNMQGNIYLLLQKGFDQFAALSESIIHNKFNFFISVLDSIDTSKLNKQTDDQGRNLMHILAEHANEKNVDKELLNEVYQLIIKLKVNIEASDNEGRIPLHYALKSQNIQVASMLLSNKTAKQVVKLCNTCDNSNISAFAMIFDKLRNNQQGGSSPLVQEAINLFGTNIKEMLPFIRFNRKAFPYTQLSFMVDDNESIHPLILLLETVKTLDYLSVDIQSFDLTLRCDENGMCLIDWLFKLGMITFLKHHLFKTVVTDYLKNKSNLKKIEDILSTPTKRNLYINTQRVAQFVSETFGVQLKIDLKLNIAKFHKMFEGKSKVIYDYEKDSEAYLDKEIPKLMKDVKKDEEVKCTLDSTQDTEKHCEVVKDEESGYYFDAVMKKVDIKKYYYGLDNFYVIQILKDEVKKLYILWTRWGRSGSIGQYQRTPFSTLEAAKQEFCKVFKQKSGWSWKEISNYVKLPKKYEIKRLGGKLLSKSDARLKFSNRDFDYNKVVISFDDLKDKVECKSNKGIIDFLKPLVDDNEMYNSLQNSKLCNSLLLLAPQDKDTIDKGIEILNKMKVKLEEANKCRSKSNFDDYTVKMEQLANLNSEYLEVIPKTNPEHIEAILNDYQVQNEITLLKSVYSLSFKIRIALGAYQNAKKVNPYDYVLGSLPINLSVLDPNSDQAELILHYLNSQPIHGHTLTNIIKVEGLDYSDKEDKRFASTPNHKMLWHGTSAENILSILKQGLKIKPTEAARHGNRFGPGIYFSDCFNLSLCFSAASNAQRYIILCEVATGHMANVLTMPAEGLNKESGFDTIRVMCGSGPNWDSSITQDGVIYPIGQFTNYETPYIMGKNSLPQYNYSEFQKFVQDKVNKASKRGKKTKLKDESESDVEMKDDEAMSDVEDNSEASYQAHLTKKTKNKIIEFDPNKKEPLYPNEITAGFKEMMKTVGINNFYYQNYQSEYVVYDKALVRVRYIVQLSTKS